MTAFAFLLSLTANLILLTLWIESRKSSRFWRRNFNAAHALFMGELRSQSSRAQAEINDALRRDWESRHRLRDRDLN